MVPEKRCAPAPSFQCAPRLWSHSASRIAMLALIATVAVPGCRPARDETVLEPVHRLLERPGGPPIWYCAADDETRPAVGCTPSFPVATETRIVRDGSVLSRRYRLPNDLAAGAYVIEPTLQLRDREGSQVLPSSVQRLDRGQEFEVRFPVGDDAPAVLAAVGVRARPVPPSTESTETDPVPVGAGAILRVGIALESIGVPADAAPAEFTLVARTPTADHELLRTVLDPAKPEAHRWTDYRFALDALAGQTARFVFSSRVVPRAGDGPAAFSFPLWGAPTILEPRPRGSAPNLILVSVDTLRADHLGTYGCDLPTSPLIDRFAGQGTLFERVMAAYPSTPASHMTMLTGVYPAVHHVVGPLTPLRPEIPTLAQLLAARGWETAAVTEDGMLVGGSGFQRGFSYYRENKGASIWDASGQVDVTFPAGVRWLEEHRGERFFLFLHTYQVHEPYSPPPQYNLFTTYRENGQDVPITPSTPAAIRDRHLYAGEVRFVDVELGRVLDRLAALGEEERTLVVVTSDHGEEFYEHGWKGHDETLYDEVLHVPLILRGPGIPAGLRVPVPVSLADLTPTLLDLLGVPPPTTIQGTSLVPLLKDPKAPGFSERPAFAELTKRRQPYLSGVRAGGRMWILPDVPGRPPEVYDLQADPGEHHNIATDELIAEGRTLVQGYRATAFALEADLAKGSAAAAAAPPSLDERTVKKLHALGYVE
jgi:arylsulfatase A-like enzyme